MKTWSALMMMLLLVILVLPRESVANDTNLAPRTDWALDLMSTALIEDSLDAIVLGALSLDAAYRIGFRSESVPIRSVLFDLRLVPVYVLDVVWSRVGKMPRFIFYYSSASYGFEDWDWWDPEVPYIDPPAYPEQPMVCLFFLKRSSGPSEQYVERCIERREAVDRAYREGKSLDEVMKLLGLEGVGEQRDDLRVGWGRVLRGCKGKGATANHEFGFCGFAQARTSRVGKAFYAASRICGRFA